MALTVRDVMTPDVEMAAEDDDVVAVARLLAEQDVGAVPVCGNDNRLKGVVTDRDIVVRVVAEDRDPRTVSAGDIGGGEESLVTVGADAPIEDALERMSAEGVRRLPVIDRGEVVGVIGLADLTGRVEPATIGEAIRRLVRK